MANIKRVTLSEAPSSSLSDKAYFLVRERILHGELRPGDVVSPRRLAKEFKMSLLPVSQALRQLESDKLLESRPRAGTRVRVPQAEEVRGQCVVREALEAQSARLCCMHATIKERFELLRMAKQLDTLYARLEFEDDAELQYLVHTHHFELHMRIAEYAHCPELRDAIEKNQVLIYNWFFDLAARRRALPPRFHVELLEAVTGPEPLSADEAMRKHVQYGVARTLEQVVSQAANDWRLRRRHASNRNPQSKTRVSIPVLDSSRSPGRGKLPSEPVRD